jgi:hypothetical protein
LWTLINYRWPPLAEHLEKYPKMVKYVGEKNKDILKILEIPENLHDSFQDSLIYDLTRGNIIKGTFLDENMVKEIAFSCTRD